MIILVDKERIMQLTGYTNSQSQKLIRTAKARLVEDGFSWYKNKRVGRVPIKVIEDILGFELSSNHDIISNVQEDTVVEKGVQNDSN